MRVSAYLYVFLYSLFSFDVENKLMITITITTATISFSHDSPSSVTTLLEIAMSSLCVVLRVYVHVFLGSTRKVINLGKLEVASIYLG